MWIQIHRELLSRIGKRDEEEHMTRVSKRERKWSKKEETLSRIGKREEESIKTEGGVHDPS